MTLLMSVHRHVGVNILPLHSDTWSCPNHFPHFDTKLEVLFVVQICVREGVEKKEDRGER